MATPIPENAARFTVADVVRATGGALVSGTVDGRASSTVTTDSRRVREGAVFVALRGERHDGHAFVPGAAAAGALAVVVERGAAVDAPGAAVIEVDDTLVAWGDLAALHVERWRAAGEGRRIVAVTGSAGKTTTKELVAALLGAVGPCHRTAGNLNNRIGVPSVVFALEDAHRFCVLEMGMSLPGEIAAVARIARPDVAIVTNVGVAHAEGVGGREGVLREKASIFTHLADDGVAVTYGDDTWGLRAGETRGARRLLTFGRDQGATYRLAAREALGPDGSRVTITHGSVSRTVRLPVPGEAAAVDLAAALAAQEAATGVVLDGAALDAALAKMRIPGRAEIRRLGGDVIVVDDTYNANPSSVQASLASLAEIAGGRRAVVVLGEMKELGALAEAEHDALGEPIAASGAALVIGCGGLVDRALARARSLGADVVIAADTDAAAREAVARVRDGDVVLAKGSRSVGVERVVAALVGQRGEISQEAWPAAAKSADSKG